MLGLWERFPLGPVATRIHYGVFPYAHYAYGVYYAARSAASLGIPRITAIEFGVAGGRGLVALEQASAEIERDTGVGIDVVGFDTGEGMPPAVDYRDLPHIWGAGFYKMEPEKLRARLQRAQLVLGDLAVTLPQWMRDPQRSPLGFVAFDLDYYSSTKVALGLFEGDEASHLPRVYCYFDDVCCTALGCMSEFQGELLAIREFNEAHAQRKIARIEQVRAHRPRWEIWQERMFAFHNFAHSKYNVTVVPDTYKERQMPL
jgi:hypothetical protein